MSPFKVKVHSADADEVRGLININMKEGNIVTILVNRVFLLRVDQFPSLQTIENSYKNS